MKNKKTILFSLLILIIVLTACESEQPGFLIVEKQGTTITNSIINNITNNITNAGSNITNNITNNYTLGNTSFSCNDANDYLYNVSVLNGQLTGLCAADSTGGGGDGTGGWTNTSTMTSTSLIVNVSQTVIAYNISFQNTSGTVLNSLYLNPTGNAVNVLAQLYANTILSSGTQIYTDGDIFTRGSGGDLWLGTSSQSNANITLTPSSIQLRGSAGGINTTYLTVQNLNSGTSCDLKAFSNGTVYCGTDASGNVNNYSIILDAQYNITNQIWINRTEALTISNNLQNNITSVNTSSLQITTAINTYVNRSLWTTIDNYPAGCTLGQAVLSIGDTLVCVEDQNNYTTSISFSGSILSLSRNGLVTLTATIPNNAITLDAGNNLTNVYSGLQNKTTLACQNITGAVSDLCTITGGSGSGDGTGGWANTTINTSTTLDVFSLGEFYEHGMVDLISTQQYFCDFVVTQATTMCYPNYIGAAVGTGGASASYAGNTTKPGVVSISKGTAANSGYRYQTDVNAFLLNGSERYSTRMLFFQDTLNQTWWRIGFCNSATVGTECTNAVAYNITNLTVNAMTRNAAATTAATTTFTMTSGQWYTFIIQLNQNATNANFTIYNDTLAMVYSQVLSANIPVADGRYVGSGTIGGTQQANSAAAIRALLDFQNTEIRRTMTARII